MLQVKRAQVFCLAIALSIGGPLWAQKPQTERRFEVSKQLDILNAIVKEVEMFYVDSVETEKVVRRGIDAMLKGLDPYTEYYPEQETDNIKMLVTGEYGGVGAYIRARDGGVIISEPFEGMPAALAGLKAGDRILMIDTADVRKATTERVSELLKGTPNSKVVIKIERPGEKKPRKVEVTRKQVSLKQVVHYGVYGDGTGYIYLEGFKERSADEVREALEDLKQNHHIKSLVLDLRDNGGGLLSSAVQIVNLFVPKGREVLSTRGKMKLWDRTYRTTLDPVDSVIPLAVLINGNSASASEIVSGALQDMDRAVVMGQKSYGKGLVQTTMQLPYDGTIKLTTAKYYIPSGRCIQRINYRSVREGKGEQVTPDSLTQVFHTRAGREVRDAGGILPDVKVTADSLPTMLFYLTYSNDAFDWITRYTEQHKTIASPLEFRLSAADYADFSQYMIDKKFDYDRQSSKELKQLEDLAKFEGYYERTKAEFERLKTLLVPDLKHDLDYHKAAIERQLTTSILTRYYYDRGARERGVTEDKVIAEGLKLLADGTRYRQLLSAPAKK